MALTEEVKGVTDATGSELAAYGAVALAAWRGDEAETSRLIETTLDDVVSRGEGMGVAISEFLAALLYNGLGRYAEALASAERACEYNDLAVLAWALTELVEAASRSNQKRCWNCSTPATLRVHPGQRHGLGPRYRGPFACTAQRGRCRRTVLSGSDRTAESHSCAGRACPFPSPLWRMAAADRKAC